MSSIPVGAAITRWACRPITRWFLACAPRSTSDGTLTRLMRKVGHARPTGAHATSGGSTQRSRPAATSVIPTLARLGAGLDDHLSLVLVRSHRPKRLIVAG